MYLDFADRVGRGPKMYVIYGSLRITTPNRVSSSYEKSLSVHQFFLASIAGVDLGRAKMPKTDDGLPASLTLSDCSC